MATSRPFDGYSYYINEDSDDEDLRKDSSDDEDLNEIDVFLHGTKEQQIKALKSLTGDEASSDEDEFEKMMQNELENKVKKITNSWKKSEKTDNSEAAASSSQSSTFYDDVYFDSDEEQSSSSSRKRVLTNDELLYDPSADEEDQKWVDSRRKRIKEKPDVPDDKSFQSKKPDGSDAVLNCPACMTTLCVDCQRHSIYHNQYRAMFVMNCDVKMDEALHYKPKKRKEFKRHKKHGETRTMEQSELKSEEFTAVSQSDNAKNTYHPVNCSKCSTEVAVFDAEEIYHFFNILASYS